MKKFFSIIFLHIKYFFVNPLWRSLYADSVMFLTILANAFIWYMYLKQFRGILGITPIAYSTGVLGLNIFLANITYRKEAMISFILIGIGLLIQIFVLFFMKFAIMRSF